MPPNDELFMRSNAKPQGITCWHVPHGSSGPTSCLNLIHYELCTKLEGVMYWQLLHATDI